MPDSTLNYFVSSGTTAQRTAHVPDPPTAGNAPPTFGYLFFDTDDSTLYAWDGMAWVATGGSGTASPVTVGVTVDGGGSAITTGIKGYVQIAVSGTITSWTLLADQAGDVEFDVFLDAFVSYPSTTSIVASAPPELTAAASATDSTLTGWTTSVTAGDVFGFEVVSAATIERVTLEIRVTP